MVQLKMKVKVNEIDTLRIQFIAEKSIPLVSVHVPSSTSIQVPSESSAGNHALAEINETDDSETDYMPVQKWQKTTTTRKNHSRKTSSNSMTNHASNNKSGLPRKKGTTATKEPRKNTSKSTYTWTQTIYEHDHIDFAVRPGPTFRRQSLPNNEECQAIDMFDKFYDDIVFNMIVKFTNKLAQSKVQLWVHVTIPEMKAFFTMCIFMGIVKLPDIYN